MKVKALIAFLLLQNPESRVVISDKTDYVRVGLIRPLRLGDIEEVQLGEVTEDNDSWLCEWGEPSLECEGPLAGLLVGPR